MKHRFPNSKMSPGRRKTLVWLGGLGASPFCFAQAAKKPFRMAVSENYAPFYMVKDGKVAGIAVDILREVIGRQMGLDIQFEAFPWARAQAMVQTHGFDALCTIATPNRLAYTVASVEPVLINNYHLFVHKDNKLLPELRKVSSIDDLRALHPTAISYLGAGWAPEHLDGIELTLAGNFENVMRMLIARRADFMIDGELNVQSWITAHSDDAGRLSSEDIVMLPLVFEATRFDLLVSKTSAHLSMLPEFNDRMKVFRKSAGYRKIFQDYGINLAVK